MNAELFIEELDENQRAIFDFLHSSFLDFPEVSMKIRYRIPFYDFRSWICYINPLKKGGVELCFVKGKLLSEHGKLLQSRNRKQVAGLVIEDLKSAPVEKILDIFSEALILDES